MPAGAGDPPVPPSNTELPVPAAGDLPAPPSGPLPPPPGGDSLPPPPGGDTPPPAGGTGDDVPIPMEGDYLDEETVDLPLFGRVKASDVGMPAFTIAIGLVDGFNPCAMWVLLFLLSLLVHLKSRKKMFAVAGIFVAVSGLAYFAFMAMWLNVFQLLQFEQTVQITLGAVGIVVGAIHIKDFFAFKKGISLSIPESAKPKINERVRKIITSKSMVAAIIGAAVLAVLVNIVEVLCSIGFPILYNKILQMQGYPAWKNYAYLGLYNVAYMFDDSVMVIIAVVTLSSHRLQEKEGRWLKLISGVLILALGVVMIFKPKWLGGEFGAEAAEKVQMSQPAE